MDKVREIKMQEGRKARFAALLLAVALGAFALLGLAGCSGGSSSSTPEAADSAAQEIPDFVGAWEMTSFTLDGKKYGEKEIAQLQENGLDFFININADGTWLFCMGNETSTSEGTWARSGDGNLTLTTEKGEVNAFAIDGDTAQIGKTPFKKVGSTPRVAPAAPASSSSEEEPTPEPASESSSAESDEVSADVKEVLDSYEAFIDEYVEFMQKYKDSGNAVGMLSDYTDFLQRYTDFAKKIDAMDTSDMSTADYSYYIEVTSRVSQKLLSVI